MPHKDPEARREYHRQYMRDYLARPGAMEKHVQRVARNNVRYRAEKRALVDAILAAGACVDCGEDDPEVLDFDHVRGEKLGNISDLVRANNSMKRLQDELLKCEIRCSNCHRRATRRRERA